MSIPVIAKDPAITHYGQSHHLYAVELELPSMMDDDVPYEVVAQHDYVRHFELKHSLEKSRRG